MDPRYYASQFHKCWTVQPVPQDLTLLGSEFWSGDETPAQMDPTLPEEVWAQMPCLLRQSFTEMDPHLA